MKIGRRSERVVGEMACEDLWLGVICLSNSEIAGSPRDIFRYSLVLTCVSRLKFRGVERLDGFESLWRSRSTKLQIREIHLTGVSRAGISWFRREGNIPDSHLRFLNDF